jgi:hypothetical protein
MLVFGAEKNKTGYADMGTKLGLGLHALAVTCVLMGAVP